jgi:hypothetical protein
MQTKRFLATAMIIAAIASAFYAGSNGFGLKRSAQPTLMPTGQYTLALQGNTYYCDPVNGNTQTGDGSSGNPWGTLQSVMEAGKFNGAIIKSGDIVRLKTGFHGKVDMLNNAYTGMVRQNTDYITIEADTGAVADLSFVWVYNCAYWRFKGLRISPSFSNEKKPTGGGGIVWAIPGMYNNHIAIEDCNIFTAEDISSWDADDWQLAWSGIWASYPENLTIRGNFIHNVDNGIYSSVSSNLLIEQNVIDGFGWDGIFVTLTNSIIQDNIIKNVYDDNYDGTHSDCIQIGVQGQQEELNNHDIIIRRNYCSASIDPTRSLESIGLVPGKTAGWLQGFFLDGISNGLIENNVIIPSQYGYGISLNSYANNVKILNNTTVGCYRFTQSTPDIYLPNGVGQWGARDVIVRNNIADNFPPDSNNPPQPPPFIYENVVVDHNYDIVDSYNRYVEFVDYINGDVHLAADSNFIDAGSSLNAPNEDLDKNLRPHGQGYDVGAYEFQSGTQQTCSGTDTSCGTWQNCTNCNLQDGCSADSNRNYYCSGTSCAYTDDNCSDCSCTCGDYNKTESITNNNCSDTKDNDCDGSIDNADAGCKTTGCIDAQKLFSYISQWKTGNLGMRMLIQKMVVWKTGKICPPTAINMPSIHLP